MARNRGFARISDWGGEESRGLAALIAAGLSPLQAVEVLRQQYPGFGLRWVTLARGLNRGRPLGEAMREVGFLGPRDGLLLQAAERAGRLPEALRCIATRVECRHRRLARLKAQFWLPWGLLLIASLAGILIRVYWRGEAFAPVVVDILVRWGGVLLLTVLLLNLLRRDSRFWLSWGWRLGLRHAGLYRRFYDYEFCAQLRWPLEAGAGADQALGATAALLEAPGYRRSVLDAQRAVAAGDGLSASLVRYELLRGAETRQLLTTAEQAGRLPEAIGQRLAQERLHLDLYLDTFYEWLPRLYYVLVLIPGLGIV